MGLITLPRKKGGLQRPLKQRPYVRHGALKAGPAARTIKQWTNLVQVHILGVMRGQAFQVGACRHGYRLPTAPD